MPDSEEQKTITAKTLNGKTGTFVVGGGIGGGIVGLVLLLSQMGIIGEDTGKAIEQEKRFQEIITEIQSLKYEIQEMRKTGTFDRWTGTDMFRWSIQLKEHNPTLNVPTPEHKQ